MTTSERESERELTLEVRAAADDAAEHRRERVADTAAPELRLEILRVEQVEGLREHLDFPAREGERLAQTRIHDVDPRGVDPRIADGREAVLRPPRIHGRQVEVAATRVAGRAGDQVGVEPVAIEIPARRGRPRQR